MEEYKETLEELKDFLDNELTERYGTEEYKPKKFKAKAKPIVFTVEVATYEHEEVLHMLADEGDYILTDDNGEKWIINKDTFEHAYDILE